MKLQLIAGLILAFLLVLPVLAVMARAWSVKFKNVATNGATDKLLEDGKVSLITEAAFATRYLLGAKGTASGSAILCTAALIPLGPCVDEPANGDYATFLLLGAARGTVFMIASKAIAENTNVYATAGGKITDAVVTGAYWVGKTAPYCSAAADGEKVAVIPRFPTVNP
jgi:hypothetical protein